MSIEPHTNRYLFSSEGAKYIALGTELRAIDLLNVEGESSRQGVKRDRHFQPVT